MYVVPCRVSCTQQFVRVVDFTLAVIRRFTYDPIVSGGLILTTSICWKDFLMVHQNVLNAVMKLPRGVQDVVQNGIVAGEYCMCMLPSKFSYNLLIRECQVKQWKKHKSSCDLLKNALDSSKS